MMIYLGADHRGFKLKEELKKRLQEEGYQVSDMGNSLLDPDDDYVDFAQKVSKAVVDHKGSKGILLCGSGVGVDIVANKTKGIRSALCFDEMRAKQSREHEDVNILSLPADILNEDKLWKIVQIFLITPFSGEERHLRRIDKIKKLEGEND